VSLCPASFSVTVVIWGVSYPLFYYVSLVTGAYTNTIEAWWRVLKDGIPRCYSYYHHDETLQEYLYQQMWFVQNKENKV